MDTFDIGFIASAVVFVASIAMGLVAKKWVKKPTPTLLQGWVWIVSMFAIDFASLLALFFLAYDGALMFTIGWILDSAWFLNARFEKWIVAKAFMIASIVSVALSGVFTIHILLDTGWNKNLVAIGTSFGFTCLALFLKGMVLHRIHPISSVEAPKRYTRVF